MAKFVINSILLVFTIQSAFSQVIIPATWENSPSKSAVAVGDEVELLFRAKIDPDWYLYSSDFDPECGPMVTSFSFTPDASYELIGDLQAVHPKEKYDSIFECSVRIFREHGEFRQRLRVKNLPLRIEGSFEYQVCSDVSGKCIIFDEDFSFSDFTNTVKKKKPKAEPADTSEYSNSVPEEDHQPVETASVTSDPKRKLIPDSTSYSSANGPVLDESLFDSTGELAQTPSLWWFMILSFVAGLTALLTPCVFPMIPMTVSFFTNKNGTRKALIYGLSIIVIYTAIGSILAPLMGPETANSISTAWLPNIIFFLVFFFFALSFFGLFDLTLPSSMVNAMDQKAERGGLIGVFFMAFTLVLVSFSCTGPIVGSILVGSAGGQVLKPIIGMFGFSLAFAIPFTLFAIFPGWLNKLPKSGGWLNSVKVVLGFVELALAFKFLSIADQAYHWGIMDRDINIAIWVVIFSLLGFYLLGQIRLPHDSRMEHIGVPRFLLAILVFVFVVYLIPGLWGAPLKALAGYLPPMHTHDFNLLEEKADLRDLGSCDPPKYSDFLSLPHGLSGYFDYDQALTCAREQNKPVFIDFTGHGCTNCREMEAVVWSDPRVLKILRKDYVVVALYVDDKTELPEDEWYTSSYDNKVKKTIGKQNADLQIRRLTNNAQPFYVLLGLDEKVLARPLGYNKNVETFLEFLNKGKSQFNARYNQ